jgi:zinc transport system ATP-binding protein
MSEDVLQVKNLNVEFDREQVLENISFDLHEKELLVILGPNGAGKSTLLRTLLGLVPFRGQIQWRKDVHLAYVPDEFIIPEGLPLSLKELFRFKKIHPEKILQALEGVGIEASGKFLEKRLDTFSSGQLRRTLIAWAMSDRPDVILLDEPMLYIDIHGRETIYDSLVRLWEEEKQSIILVSHEIGEVCKKADKILALNKRKLFYGKPEEIITPENLAKIYGSPISL